MICDHLSEVATPTEGGVVVYFEGQSVAHSGRCRSERVHSKWGSGHIWSHELFETPSSYGCIARFYVALDPDVHQATWRNFAKQFTTAAESGAA